MSDESLSIYTHYTLHTVITSIFVGLKLEQLIQAMEISISNRNSRKRVSERPSLEEWDSVRYTRLIIGVANALKQIDKHTQSLQSFPKLYPLIYSIFKVCTLAV